MSAPTRIVYGERNTYRLDPYVRDLSGRFAPKPATPPPPIQDLEAQSPVIDLTGGNKGAFTSGPDGSCYWRVRVIKDGSSYRVEYLED